MNHELLARNTNTNFIRIAPEKPVLWTGFTQLESPAACSGDKDEFFLKRARGLMPRVSRPVRRAKVF